MKKMLFLAALLLGAYATVQAQDRQKKKSDTEKTNPQPAVKSEPTPDGQANRQKAEEEIRKARAEKRAKMEETKKNVKGRIATDTVSGKR